MPSLPQRGELKIKKLKVRIFTLIPKRDFVAKFKQLNATNQRYIIAMQQALAYAQKAEKRGQTQTIN